MGGTVGDGGMRTFGDGNMRPGEIKKTNETTLAIIRHKK